MIDPGIASTIEATLTSSSYYDYFLEVSRGNVPGQEPVFVTGFDSAVGTTEKTIGGNSIRHTFPTSAQALEILSTSTSDTSGGTGARTVIVTGLADDYTTQSETVTLNGTTAVDLVNSYLRINDLTVGTVGSNKTNVGTITVRYDGGGTYQSSIPAGRGTSTDAVYTVPADKTDFLVEYFISVEKGEDALIHLYRTNFGGPQVVRFSVPLYQNTSKRQFTIPVQVTPKADIELTAVATNANTQVYVSLLFNSIDN